MEKTKGSCVSTCVLKTFRPALAFLVSIAIVFSPVVGTLSTASAAPKPLAADHRDGDDRDKDKSQHGEHYNPYFKGNQDKDHDHDFDFGHEDNGGCDLRSARGEIKHVIYIQFDNVHYERDNPSVFSDLELMPHLLNFMQNDGTLLTDSHTPLISHTADDIITSLTGVYGDRHGGSIANSFRVYGPPPVSSTDAGQASVPTFTYWTDPVYSLAFPAEPSTFDSRPIMLSADGTHAAPAPWVPFTRAGCNVGAVSIANMELENVTGDVVNVFGSGSPEATEGTTNSTLAIADFEGIAIHCAKKTACSSSPNAKPDLLADEPSGYTGFQGIYGHKYVAPFIVPAAPDPLNDGSGNLLDFDGNLITDSHGNKGFPGFGPIDAAQTLAYVEDMQEHGVPVTFAYISDIHDNPSATNPYAPANCKSDPETGALGPGDICKKALADAYDEAFNKFFTRLKSHGIDQSNTLFLITTEEQDHFAGGTPNNAPCNGKTVFCTYDLTGKGAHGLGEVDLGLTALLNQLDSGFLTGPPAVSYNVHSDMAPAIYLGGQPKPGDPLFPNVRRFERDAGNLLVVTNPYTGLMEHVTTAMADPVEMNLLHMITADPQRTPSFILFGNPNYFFLTAGETTIVPNDLTMPLGSTGFAWNHGGIQPEITTTWCGLVGPGINVHGVDSSTFADETDYRPTILALTGLQDDYQHEGRVLVETFKPWAIPDGISDSSDEYVELARAFKQINAPLGQLAMDSLRISTAALKDATSGDPVYTSLENDITNFTITRNAIANQMLLLLEGAAFHGQIITEHEEQNLSHQAQSLLNSVHTKALLYPPIL